MAQSGAIVIVGAGQAGIQLAASLRMARDERRIILIGDETILPYQRPPLSKDYLEGKISRGGMNLRPERFYSEQKIEVFFGSKVTSIDRKGKRVHLNSGDAFEYDRLILATGSRNRELPIPGSDLPSVYQLRSMLDADRLTMTLKGARKAVVIGGGFIGLEFAALAVRRGINVTVVEGAERLLVRSASVETSKYIESFHASSGITFRFGSVVRRIICDDEQVTSVEIADGRIVAADMVLVGVGAVPNTELAAACGLVTENGIVVDQYLTTSDPAIHAIGDCAVFPSPFAKGRFVRIESVQNAVDQAKSLANRLIGKGSAYASLPWFWSHQGPLKLQIAGLSTPHDVAVCRKDKQGATVYCFKNDSLVGVETINRPADHVMARKLLAGSSSISPDDVRSPDFDLRACIGSPLKAAASIGCMKHG